MPRQKIAEVILVHEGGRTEHFVAPYDTIVASDVETHTEDDPTKPIFYWTLMIAPQKRS